MGVIALPSAGTVYVDACAVIYHVEKIDPFFSAALPLWDALDLGTQEIVTSDLCLLEALVKPLRDGNTSLVQLYRDVLLGTIGLTCPPTNRSTLEAAAQLRASHHLKTPDSIHAATALDAGCALFVTNDAAFRKVSGLPVAVLGEIAASP